MVKYTWHLYNWSEIAGRWEKCGIYSKFKNAAFRMKDLTLDGFAVRVHVTEKFVEDKKKKN